MSGSKVVMQVVEGELEEALLETSGSGLLRGASFGVRREPRIAMRFRFWARRACVQFVFLSFEECPLSNWDLSRVRALAAI